MEEEGGDVGGEVGRERRGEFQIVDMFSSGKVGPGLRWRRRERGRGERGGASWWVPGMGV